MAVPFILLGGAALAGITGAVKSVSAHTKNANAKQIVAEAQNIYDEAREMLEEQRTCTAECLKRLGALKVDIWSKEMNDFIRTFRAFKNVRMESDVAGDERLKLKCQGTENLKNMEVAALKATEIARAGVASLGTGVLAGIASYGGAMMFASASTGTAIASLSGVAATNATLAWFGGGALTAGGLGMAGGTLVLGGIVVGPVLAAAGLIMNAKADENLASAEVTAARAETAVEKMAVMTDFMKKTASIAENYSDFLVRFRSAFYPVVNEMKYMEQRTRQKQKRMLYDSDDEKIDFNSLTEAEQKKIHQAWLMAQIMCSVLSEPLLTPAGELASEAQTTLRNARNVYPAFAQGRYGF